MLGKNYVFSFLRILLWLWHRPGHGEVDGGHHGDNLTLTFLSSLSPKLQPYVIVSLLGTGQGMSLIMNGSFEAATAALHIIKGIFNHLFCNSPTHADMERIFYAKLNLWEMTEFYWTDFSGCGMKGNLYSCHNGDQWKTSGLLVGGVGYASDIQVYSETKRWLGSYRYTVACMQFINL